MFENINQERTQIKRSKTPPKKRLKVDTKSTQKLLAQVFRTIPKAHRTGHSDVHAKRKGPDERRNHLPKPYRKAQRGGTHEAPTRIIVRGTHPPYRLLYFSNLNPHSLDQSIDIERLKNKYNEWLKGEKLSKIEIVREHIHHLPELEYNDLGKYLDEKM